MKHFSKITKKLLIVTIVVMTLLSVVYAVEVDDPYVRSYIVNPPITTLQSK